MFESFRIKDLKTVRKSPEIKSVTRMVPCWVDINLWQGQVKDFLDLGKYSRQRAYIKLTKLIQAKQSWAWVKGRHQIDTGELSWTPNTTEKSWRRPSQRLMSTLQWIFSYLAASKLWSWPLPCIKAVDHGSCMKALIHGKDWYLLHIQDAAGKQVRTGHQSRQEWKCNVQPRKKNISSFLKKYSQKSWIKFEIRIEALKSDDSLTT